MSRHLRSAHTAALAVATLALAVTLACAQSTKGGQQQQQQQRLSPTSSYSSSSTSASTLLQSPGAQIRQQQQQYSTPATLPRPIQPSAQSGTKHQRHQSHVQQQQSNDNNYGGQQQTEARTTTEDPLADSEPALYGSVAGQPGVDFPDYTRIPKTSFSCEGKGFDFGFYADEEAGCQVYHVCWSGRRESFLCGVGTVFNQAILACDYWHSVDCSKSSQFYGVNSELGKASGEPATNTGLQRVRPVAASLPNVQQQQQRQQFSQNNNNNNNYAEPIGQRRVQQSPAQILQQQQQQAPYGNNDEPEQQQQIAASSTANRQQSYGNNNFGQPTQQRIQSSQFQPTSSFNYNNNQQQQQEKVEIVPSSKTNTRQQQQQAITSTPASTTTTTLANPAGTKAQSASRSRVSPSFNMDLNQKVNSLIESPVRPPLSKAAPSPPTTTLLSKTAQQTRGHISPPPSTRRPIQQPATNFARLAVARAQQQGSQNLNSGRKSLTPTVFQPQTSYTQQEPRQQQQQQEQQFDSEVDEQNNFDDLPVQTSTAPATGSAPSGAYSSPPSLATTRQSNGNNFAPQQQLVIQSGGGPDGSSAITTQYDTLQPAGQANQQQQQVDHDAPQQQQRQTQNNGNIENGYESSLIDSNDPANDDFRASGAKAAASHNQNWYIMRSI